LAEGEQSRAHDDLGMTRLVPKFALYPLAVLAVVAVVGCGGNSNSTRPAAADGNATVNVAKTGLGNVLVDAQGHTLYLFKKDVGGKSSCFGECATDWPPARVSGEPTVGAGLTAAKAATTARSDGKPELTYAGHPLYRFSGDPKPGDANGNGLSEFGGKWYAVTASGRQVGNGGSAPTSNTTGGSAYGY
jgi:predicted lipoprotein with Yx(FWY)xxD motif